MRLTAIILIITLSFTSCLQEPIDLENHVECSPEAFVGVWEYQSTNGTVLDSIPDITISLAENREDADIFVDSLLYYDVRSYPGCTAGDVSGLLDLTYELKSNNELVRKSSFLVVFGGTDLYTRK